MDWGDLQYVLAIARHGSLGGGARDLRVHHSTAYRKLEAIERALGVRLFERHRDGYSLTAQGEVLAEAAAEIEGVAQTAERKVLGADLKLSGTIRVSTSELIGLYLLPDLLPAFSRGYPDIDLEVLISNRLVSLTRRDADVAIRATDHPPEHLVGRRISGMPFCGYAHHRLVQPGAEHGSAKAYEWIGFDESISQHPLGRWLTRMLGSRRCHLKFDSVAAVREAAVRGLGAAVLPCFVGDAAPGLQRVTPVQMERGFDIWVLTHPDLRSSARIRAFRDWVGDAIGLSPLVGGANIADTGQR